MWTFITRSGGTTLMPPSCFRTDSPQRALEAALKQCERLEMSPDEILITRKED